MGSGLRPNDPGMRLAIRGWVHGGSIGGALGAAVRFDSPADIVKRHGEHGPREFTDVFGKRGAITSDMQLTLLVMDGMIRAHIRNSWHFTDPVDEVALAMRRWLLMAQDGWFPGHNELFQRRWADRTTVEALRRFADGGELGTIERPINDSQENSVLSRAGVAALWSDDLTEVFAVGARIAALTHGHPNAYLAAGAYAVMVQFAIRSSNLIRAVDAARSVLRGWDGHEEVDAALETAVEALFTDQDKPLDPAYMESFGDSSTAMGALAIAIRAVISEHRFEYVLGRAVTIAGDSAATGLLTGSLYGIASGANALPAELVSQLELSTEMAKLAEWVCLEYGGEPPQGHDYYAGFPFVKP
jgi:ADP-ribosyl-[dinitrogen reductase] hydrolase